MDISISRNKIVEHVRMMCYIQIHLNPGPADGSIGFAVHSTLLSVLFPIPRNIPCTNNIAYFIMGNRWTYSTPCENCTARNLLHVLSFNQLIGKWLHMPATSPLWLLRLNMYIECVREWVRFVGSNPLNILLHKQISIVILYGSLVFTCLVYNIYYILRYHCHQNSPNSILNSDSRFFDVQTQGNWCLHVVCNVDWLCEVPTAKQFQ